MHSKNNEILIDKKVSETVSEIDYSFLEGFLEITSIENEKKFRQSLLGYEKAIFENDLKKDFSKEEKHINDGISFYKVLMSTIQRHFKETKENEISFIISEFINIYIPKNKEIIEQWKLKKISFEELEKSKNIAIKDLQQFSRIIQETMVLYYNMDQIANTIPHCCLFTKDNLINFIVSLLFDKKEVYNLIYEYQKTSSFHFEKLYRRALLSLSGLETNIVEIAGAFQLQNNELKNEKLLLKSKSDKILNDTIEEESTEEKKLEKKFSIEIEGEIQELVEFNEQPYSKAIKLLSEIKTIQTPLGKLQRILETGESINLCIKEFYDNKLNGEKKKLDVDMGDLLDKNKLNREKPKLVVDMRDLLAIMLFIVVKSKVKRLRAQLRIIEDFTTDKILVSKHGFFLIILQMCLKLLENLDEETLKNTLKIKIKIREWIKDNRIILK